jgi:hypothetical protein
MTYHQLLLTLHILTISLGIGVGFANLFGMAIAKNQTAEAAAGMALLRRKIAPLMDANLLLVLITGGLLLANLGGASGLAPTFHVKMAAVAVWVISHFAARITSGQMMRSGNMALASRAQNFTRLGWTAAVVALVCAVLTFAA